MALPTRKSAAQSLYVAVDALNHRMSGGALANLLSESAALLSEADWQLNAIEEYLNSQNAPTHNSLGDPLNLLGRTRLLVEKKSDAQA